MDAFHGTDPGQCLWSSSGNRYQQSLTYLALVICKSSGRRAEGPLPSKAFRREGGGRAEEGEEEEEEGGGRVNVPGSLVLDSHKVEIE